MKNLSVKLKMTIIGMMVVVFMLFSIEFSVSGMRAIDERILQEEADNIRKDYDDSIKQQVAQVISLLETYQAEIEAGTYTREEGMKQAADKVRALRYGVDGYFWVDLSDGTNVVLLGNDIEGTNRLGTEDVTGFRMVKDFIEGAVAQGSYYCDYQYPKEGGTEPMPKRAYTEYFEPFDWVVGTGNYIDNIEGDRTRVYQPENQDIYHSVYCVCHCDYLMPLDYHSQHNKTVTPSRGNPSQYVRR